MNKIKNLKIKFSWNSRSKIRDIPTLPKLFPPQGKEMKLNHLFSPMMWSKAYLKQPLTPPQRKIVVAYYTSNHTLAIAIGRWLTIPISRENIWCHFCSYNVAENEFHFMLKCPLYTSIRIRFPSLFQNVVLGSLKSFVQLKHQLDLSCKLMDAIALHHSREFSLFDTILMYF